LRKLAVRLEEVIRSASAWDAPAADSPPRSTSPLTGDAGLSPLTPGHYGDGPQLEHVLEQVSVPRIGVGRPRTRPDHVLADKAYTSRKNRHYLRRRGIWHTIPERLDQQRHRKNRGSRGGRPTGFDSEQYKKRNTVERAINRLKGFRAVGEVDSGRPAGFSTSGFPRAASRTRRARLRAPGSPQIPFRGVQFVMP
jgi:transposase